MVKKVIGGFLALAGVDLYRRHNREKKRDRARQLDEAAALLAVSLYAGIANDVVIVYEDEALTMKTMIPKSDYRYQALKGAVERNWRYLSTLKNGVKIYQKSV
ncbi:MAG: hypothetical protein OXI77_17665 [Chloroflexota bacterium]|nr:hypothetical protein [Chloroflexota bacterium]MDE2908543.1 hypothetical protein [Chloroflexota bacterium]